MHYFVILKLLKKYFCGNVDSAFGGIQGIVGNVCVFHDAVISTKLFLGKLLLLPNLKKGENI